MWFGIGDNGGLLCTVSNFRIPLILRISLSSDKISFLKNTSAPWGYIIPFIAKSL
jgi:hypothetical protein